jgi:hypothetical protein
VRWGEQEVSMGEMRNSYKNVPENLKGRDLLGDLSVDG